jgi:hypothetical protein
MLQSLLSAIIDTLLSGAAAIIICVFGLESVIELAAALFGLGCIAVGFVAWLGH